MSPSTSTIAPGTVGAAVRAIRRFAADVVHGHLLESADIRQFSAAGVPLVLTIHNMRPGWPEGLETLQAGDATLLGRRVPVPWRTNCVRVSIPIPVRTVWNGVDFGPCSRTPAVQEAACAMRRRLGIAPDAFVLVALANPRPQKRLERLPAIVTATREEFARRKIDREVALLVAGQPSRVNPTAAEAEAALRAAIDEHRLGGHAPCSWHRGRRTRSAGGFRCNGFRQRVRGLEFGAGGGVGCRAAACGDGRWRKLGTRLGEPGGPPS